MSFATTIAKSLKHARNSRRIITAASRPRFSTMECSRETFMDLPQQDECIQNDLVYSLSMANTTFDSDNDTSPLHRQLNHRQKEMLSQSLAMALALPMSSSNGDSNGNGDGSDEPLSLLAQELNRIKNLDFSAPLLSREEFRATIVGRTSLGPP